MAKFGLELEINKAKIIVLGRFAKHYNRTAKSKHRVHVM
jgi:hypothetical protein